MTSDELAHYLLVAAEGGGEPVIMQLAPGRLEWIDAGAMRMRDALVQTGALMVYADGADMPHNAWQQGSLRDDFDFGPVVMVDGPALARLAPDIVKKGVRGSAFYRLWLALSREGAILHLPEALYRFTAAEIDKSAFDYVDPCNREIQAEMEQACTEHLEAIDALVDAGSVETLPLSLFDAHGFEVEATVVIPVRNRKSTVADAVHSALSQQAPFKFNVIVVDNHSTDGTSEVLDQIAATDPRLIVVRPTVQDLGIGGCWNAAIEHPRCGRYAVQLDSDDVYSGPDTLARIVEKFNADRCAMVVGSYRLTDFNLNTIPPGIIDHREWTDANGRNNLLRINGMGAPRAFLVPLLRRDAIRFANVSYGEDYAMALRLGRQYPISRIFEELYLCRRWTGNSDAAPTRAQLNRNNEYKDRLRTIELFARQQRNRRLL